MGYTVQQIAGNPYLQFIAILVSVIAFANGVWKVLRWINKWVKSIYKNGVVDTIRRSNYSIAKIGIIDSKDPVLFISSIVSTTVMLIGYTVLFIVYTILIMEASNITNQNLLSNLFIIFGTLYLCISGTRLLMLSRKLLLISKAARRSRLKLLFARRGRSK